ncbi:MAG: hypothetical protein PWR13_997 [Archaeoglobi archaeon]|nr:hypothetical protein [Archaeoglobi archaeon]
MRFLKMGGENTENYEKNLFKLFFEETYWTHLHKCPTDGKNRFTKMCADRWLKREVELAVGEGAEVLICLGEDVKKCVCDNFNFEGIEKIKLPHPSTANNKKWSSKSNDDLKDKIYKILAHV